MLDHDAVDAFRRRALNPEHPVLHGSAQNGDIFFQNREASNKYYDAVPEIVVDYMNQVNENVVLTINHSITMELQMQKSNYCNGFCM